VGDEEEAGEMLARSERSARSSGFRRPLKSSGNVASPKATTAAKPVIPVFHPLAYRSVVADWPIACREQWGRRANNLEESGLSWRDAETQAFVEVWHQLRSSLQAVPLAALNETAASAD